MAISKLFARLVLLSLIATFQYAAEKRDWKEGTMVSGMVNSAGAAQRYTYVVSDGMYLYSIAYDHPLKVHSHQTIKFTVEKDRLTLLDLDGKEYPSQIYKRDPLIYDPPLGH
jgi:hypothetical protein